MNGGERYDEPRRIMIIDDDEDILNLFNDFLTKIGYDVVSYSDPHAALEEIRQGPMRYSLILTDIRMPGISGLELIKNVCKINQNIRIMLMSAFEINGEDLRELRYDKHVQKPIHLQSLALAIEKILKS